MARGLSSACSPRPVGLGLGQGRRHAQGTLLHINVDGSPTNFQKIGTSRLLRVRAARDTVLDASNLDSVAREKLPGLPDEGQFTFKINLDPADTVHLAVKTARRNRTLCEFKLTLTERARRS
jgi:hypothetical protein